MAGSATMTDVTELDVPAEGGELGGIHTGVETNPSGTLAVVLLSGAAIAVAARSGAVALVCVIGLLQVLFAAAWVYGTSLQGRKGALVIGVGAAAAADAVVSVFPHSQLGDLVAVFGLAVPAMFVHQLMRGAARVRVIESLSGVATLVVCSVAVASLIQLRHEFPAPIGGRIVSAVAVIAVAAIAVAAFTDMVVAFPRFDEDVPRGLVAILAAAVVGAALGQLMLTPGNGFAGGRGAFAGAGLGAIVALLAVAAAFVEQSTPLPPSPSRRLRPVMVGLMPLLLVAPVGFLICLSLRS